MFTWSVWYSCQILTKFGFSLDFTEVIKIKCEGNLSNRGACWYMQTYGQMDRWTWHIMTHETGPFSDYANMPKNMVKK